MKMKSVMSKEALAAMFGADTTDTNLQATDTTDGNETLTAEELAAAEAIAEEERIAAEAAEAADNTDNAELEPNEELIALQAEFDAFKATTKEACEATDTEWEEKLTTVEEGAVSLKDIVIDQISKMRLVIGGAPADMSAWEVTAVVTEYNTSKDAFVKSIHVGSVIPKDEAEDTKETKARVIDNSVDSAAYKSLGFK